jgi:ElaB/YqjD/DUF883 family membrane-anchored ribosome-binding protein
MKERFAVLRGRARETAGETAGNLKRQAECTAAQARTRASKLAQEHPLEAIAVLGGAAFVLGFALRMWRDRRG